MFTSLAAVAAAATCAVLALMFHTSARRASDAPALRDAARAQWVFCAAIGVRWWAPHTVYGPVLACATVGYAAAAVWYLFAVQSLRQVWTPTRLVLCALGLATLGALVGLVRPDIAHTGTGLAYLVIGAIFLAAAWSALQPAPEVVRASLRVVAACAGACGLMMGGWGLAIGWAPQLVQQASSDRALAASVLLAMLLNLAAACGYMTAVVGLLFERIERHAACDPLCGALNRRGMDQHFERRRRRRNPRGVGLVVIDIDHFKRINDRHGHAAGDAVLVTCAARLRGLLRAHDALVRTGGEEFLAVLEDADAATTAAIAERMRRAIAERAFVLPDGSEVAVTISLGHAVETRSMRQPDEAILQADRALYEAKHGGRNRCVAATLTAAATGSAPWRV